MRFAKAHAYGNDFLYVEAAAAGDADLPRLAREMCDRHTGVGADGLIVFRMLDEGASMALFNADGGRAEVSGNGVRGLAALLVRAHPAAAITIQTDAGPKRLTVEGASDGRPVFRAAMGLPRDLRQVAVTAAGETLQAVVMDFGNPQCVVLGRLPDRARFERLGAVLERHALFPNGTNVEFAEVDTSGDVRILIWERGVGPTQSSGTGSCASLVAAAAFGGGRRDATVMAPGGPQRVEWRDDTVYLTGWAEVVCDGDWLRAVPPYSRR